MSDTSSLADRATKIAAGIVANAHFGGSIDSIPSAKVARKAIEIAKEIEANTLAA